MPTDDTSPPDPLPTDGHVHQQRYDGDDPYLVCHGCGGRWDAIRGTPLNVAAGVDYPPADVSTPEPGLTEAWADLAEDIESPADDIVAAGATGEAFVTKHRPLIERAAHPAPDSALREARTEGYREGRLSVWLEIQEAANDGVKLARRIAKEPDHAD